MYLTILNLPPEQRFREENIILVSVLPGGQEGAQDLNKLLEPTIAELLKMWKGVKFGVHGEGERVVRAALFLYVFARVSFMD